MPGSACLLQSVRVGNVASAGAPRPSWKCTCQGPFTSSAVSSFGHRVVVLTMSAGGTGEKTTNTDPQASRGSVMRERPSAVVSADTGAMRPCTASHNEQPVSVARNVQVAFTAWLEGFETM